MPIRSYKKHIIEVDDFPTKGVSFKDISPLLSNSELFRDTINTLSFIINRKPKYWIGIDARGFIFASALAYKNGGGLILCRKKGKLPPPVSSKSYELEYGESTLEMKDGLGTAIIVDDVLATGGTMMATNELAQNAGYHILQNLVLVDLEYVPKVDNFDLEVKSLIRYE
tara:strand:+ start:120 stop:626 length:507 start_codon:yes stop_codon:yes gene_type:complete